jgi:SAM-dependent methyltransferase
MERWLTLRRLGGIAILLLVLAGIWALRPLWYNDPASEVARLVPLLALEPGATAAEVGAGDGQMAVILAARLGASGRLYATEVDPARRRTIQDAVGKAGLHNVTVLEAGERQTHLPAGCCDAIYMRRVYHHFTNPATLDASLFEALRPGGRLAIIDFVPVRWLFWLRRPEGVPEDRGGHGIPPAVVLREVTAAGFVLDRRIDDWNSREYCLVFRKP